MPQLLQFTVHRPRADISALISQTTDFLTFWWGSLKELKHAECVEMILLNAEASVVQVCLSGAKIATLAT